MMDNLCELSAVTDILKNSRKVVAGYFMPRSTMENCGASDPRPTLAILAHPGLAEKEYDDLRSRMLIELSCGDDTQNLDVLVLNDAPPGARFDVVYHSQGIYCSSRPDRAAFEERAIMDYLDAKAIRDLMGRDENAN
ncbi:MAG: hypothetical protein JW941_02340 [Candidatus Coatesbacteria bacterium]|nr:hypothetical protein [Candidatus Coatesbacteria bacterium]